MNNATKETYQSVGVQKHTLNYTFRNVLSGTQNSQSIFDSDITEWLLLVCTPNEVMAVCERWEIKRGWGEGVRGRLFIIFYTYTKNVQSIMQIQTHNVDHVFFMLCVTRRSSPNGDTGRKKRWQTFFFCMVFFRLVLWKTRVEKKQI